MMASRDAGERWPSFVLAALIAGGVVAFVGGLITELIGDGPFGWHLGRDPTWQGGFEVLALCALLAAIAGLVKSANVRTILLLVLGELYLRRHYVDLPMLIDVLYFEILIGLGATVARVCGLARADDIRGYLRLAIAGIVLWSVGAWILSAFGFGSLKILRLYTLLLAVPAIAGRQTMLSVFLWRRFSALGGSQRACVAALAAWFLCLAARTNVVSGFDPWWYGLRGNFVLVATGSVFKSLDLVAPVNYYPKLYELLLIPVSGMHEISVIEGVSVVVLVLFALTCMDLLRTFALGFRTRLLLTALCVTVPAIANAALSPKPDLFMAWVLLFGCIEALRASREGSSSAGFWMLTAFALAFASKLSAPPFIAALLAGAVWAWFRNGRPRQSDSMPERRFATTVVLCAALVAVCVTARTWLLAGVPLVGPQQLVDLFAKLGMHLKPPAGLLSGGPPIDWRDVPALLTDQLFRPQRLAHMVISWIGNVWLYLFAIALAAQLLVRKPASERPRVPFVWIVVLATGLIVLLTFRTIERGGDGNYFALPLALAILIGGYAALKRLPSGMPTRLLLATLPLFVLSQAAYSFLSAGWAAGTRAFDFDFTRSVRDLPEQNERAFQAAGIAGIAAYLQAVPGIPRGVGYVTDGPAFRLPATFETLNFYDYWRTDALKSAEVFMAYLADHRIDYLVLPKAGTHVVKHRVAPAVAEAAQQLSSMPGVRMIEDRNYELYDLAILHAAERAPR